MKNNKKNGKDYSNIHINEDLNFETDDQDLDEQEPQPAQQESSDTDPAASQDAGLTDEASASPDEQNESQIDEQDAADTEPNPDGEQPADEHNPESCSCCADRDEYLTDLQRLQAEFDNYRKRMQTTLSEARNDGFIDAITKFLPALDSFKMATDMIQDKNTLMGIKFIEKGILDTLSKIGVDVIDTSGKFDPNFHQAIDVDKTSDAEEGMIVKEAYKGFTYKGKVIRYAQVIVKG